MSNSDSPPRPRSYVVVWAKYHRRSADQYDDGYRDYLDYHEAFQDVLRDIASPEFPVRASQIHMFLRTCFSAIVSTTLDRAPYKNSVTGQGAAQQGILECAIDIALQLAMAPATGKQLEGKAAGEGKADDADDVDDDDELQTGPVYEYCTTLRMLLSPFNFLYRCLLYTSPSPRDRG